VDEITRAGSETDAHRVPRRAALSQGRVALVGAAIAVVLAGASITLWTVASNAAPAPPDRDPVAATAQPATPTPTRTETPAASPAIAFKSSSGNIRCSLNDFSGQAAAICQQVDVNYGMPWGACSIEGQPGVFAGVRSDGPYWPCVAHWQEPADVLPYDTPVSRDGMTCSINLETGVRCTNEQGNGFTMEYDAGVAHF